MSAASIRTARLGLVGLLGVTQVAGPLGCAAMKEHVKAPHPLEQHFLHPMFVESPGSFASLRPAAPAAIPAPSAERRGTEAERKRVAKTKAKSREIARAQRVAKARRAKARRSSPRVAQRTLELPTELDAPTGATSPKPKSTVADGGTVIEVPTPTAPEPSPPAMPPVVLRTQPTPVEPPVTAEEPDAEPAEVEPPPVPQTPRAPRETAPKGIEVRRETTKPAEAARKASPTPGLGDGSARGELLAAAKRLLELKQDIDESRFLTHVLQVADLPVPKAPADAEEFSLTKAVYEARRQLSKTYGAVAQAVSGDLVFFHNTVDRDGDGRADDWFTTAGVIESVAKDGTVTFIAFARGQVRRLVMNLERPSARRVEATRGAAGKELNATLRTKSFSDRPGVAYLAGELFAGFAAVE